MALNTGPHLFRQAPHRPRTSRSRRPLLLDPLRHTIRHPFLIILLPNLFNLFRNLIQRPVLFKVLDTPVERRQFRLEDQACDGAL